MKKIIAMALLSFGAIKAPFESALEELTQKRELIAAKMAQEPEGSVPNFFDDRNDPCFLGGAFGLTESDESAVIGKFLTAIPDTKTRGALVANFALVYKKHDSSEGAWLLKKYATEQLTVRGEDPRPDLMDLNRRGIVRDSELFELHGSNWLEEFADGCTIF